MVSFTKHWYSLIYKSVSQYEAVEESKMAAIGRLYRVIFHPNNARNIGHSFPNTLMVKNCAHLFIVDAALVSFVWLFFTGQLSFCGIFGKRTLTTQPAVRGTVITYTCKSVKYFSVTAAGHVLCWNISFKNFKLLSLLQLLLTFLLLYNFRRSCP